MIKKFFDVKKLGGDYAAMIDAVEAGQKVSSFGMSFAERVVSCCALSGRVLFLTSDFVSAKRAHELFSQILGDAAVLLPSGSDVFVFKRAESLEQNANRAAALLSIVENRAKVVVASADSLFSLCPRPESLKNAVLCLEEGKDYSIDEIARQLSCMGYSKQALVSAEGQFSVRGDILDIFPVGGQPVRVEFFDTQIEKISVFTPSTQKTKEGVGRVKVGPCTNLLLDEKEKAQLAEKLEKERKTASPSFMPTVENLLFKIEQNDIDFSMDFCFPLVENNMCSILDYFGKDDAIVVDECKMVFDSFVGYFAELVSRKKTFVEAGECFSGGGLGFADKNETLEKFKTFKNLAFLKVTTSNSFFESDAVFSFKTAPVMRYTHNYNQLAKAIELWNQNDFVVFVCAKDNLFK